MKKGVAKEKTLVERGEFYLTCYGDRKTKLKPGDSISLLGNGTSSNFLMFREGLGEKKTGYLMSIEARHEDFPWLDKNKVYTSNEVRLLAVGLAVASGLSFREEKVASDVEGRYHYTFTFF